MPVALVPIALVTAIASLFTSVTNVGVRFPPGSTHLLVGNGRAGKTYRRAKILSLKDEIWQRGADIRNVVFFLRSLATYL